jgi:hypothetical protein
MVGGSGERGGEVGCDWGWTLFGVSGFVQELIHQLSLKSQILNPKP